MREFFKPWRRKIGVLTLAVACLIAAAWVRAWTYPGKWYLPLPMTTDQLGVGTARDRLLLQIVPAGPVVQRNFATAEPVRKYWNFVVAVDNYGLIDTRYSVFVIPLTLLSAYLLLSKPRPAKPPVQQPT